MKKYNSKYIISCTFISILCVILTAGIVVQTRTIKNNMLLSNSEYADTNLRNQVLKEKEKYDRAMAELEKTNDSLDKIRPKASENDSNASAKEASLKKNNLLIGLTDVTGDGITITLNDSKKASVGTIDAGDDISNYVVHEIDLLQIVNELKNAGAIAISLNDQRIISTTAINCSGNIARINGQTVGTPFVIKAVGGSFETMQRPGGYLDYLKQDVGLEVNVKLSKNLTIGKYNGVANYKYTKMIK